MHRRGFGLAQRVEVHVEQAGTEILRFANDRGEGHAVENMRHLFCNGFERATDHLKRDGIDFGGDCFDRQGLCHAVHLGSSLKSGDAGAVNARVAVFERFGDVARWHQRR